VTENIYNGPRKWPLFFSAFYLVGVAACIYLAFDFNGATNADMWLVLFVLTLPWSIISIVFIWALMHGAGLSFFACMYGTFALINSWLLYKLFCAIGNLRGKRNSDECEKGPA
jgi:hypothetical protein